VEVRGRPVVCAAALVVGAMTWGCGAETFECRSDAACQGSAGAGVCEPDGYCSFPDAACESGRRYGSHSTPEIAGACVDPEGGGTGDTGSTSPSSNTLPTSTAGASTSTSDDAGSTLGAEDSGSAGTAATTRSATSETGTPPPCADALLVETFDDAWDDMAWSASLGPGESVTVQNEELSIGVEGSVDGYGTLASTQAFEIGAVTVEVRLVTPLEWDGDEAETLIFIEDGELQARAGFAVYPASLLAVVTDPETGPMAVDVQPYDPDAHRWLRIRTDPTEVEFLTSADRETWTSFGTAPTPGPPAGGATTHLRLRAGTWTAIEFSGEARFDDVLVCASH
jgi:hypothetical protein